MIINESKISSPTCEFFDKRSDCGRVLSKKISHHTHSMATKKKPAKKATKKVAKKAVKKVAKKTVKKTAKKATKKTAKKAAKKKK